MKTSSLTISFCFLFSSLSYATCKIPVMRDFSVYGTHGIAASHSDYQGLIGSAGDIFLTHFSVEGSNRNCLAITTPGNLTINSASIHNDVEVGGRLQEKNVGFYSSIRGLTSTSVNHLSIAREMEYQSQKYGQMEPQGHSITSTRNITEATITNKLAVLDMDTSSLAYGKTFRIFGDASQVVVINIFGDDISLIDATIDLQGSITANNILWNFPSARILTIIRTGNGSHGIPGTVLAPYAALSFTEGLVTGGVFVDQVSAVLNTKSSGQVNPGSFIGFWPSESPKPSPKPVIVTPIEVVPIEVKPVVVAPKPVCHGKRCMY